MRSPGIPESSRCAAPSNSTRSRGLAHASAIGAGTTQQSISTIAAREVTVLGNGVTLECAPEAVVRVRSFSLHVRGASAIMLFKFPFQYSLDSLSVEPLHCGASNAFPA